LGVLIAALVLATQAWAMYLNDGSVENPAGVYSNPADGFCVSGIKTDGTMTFIPGITNFRDCTAYTTGLTAMVATDVTTSLKLCAAGANAGKPCNVDGDCPTSTCSVTGQTYAATTCCTTGASGCTNNVNPYGVLNWLAATQKCYDVSACIQQGASGNDGAKHTYSTSICINPSTRAGISRLDLDNTAAMCQEKGGVLADGLYGHPYGACTAYGWIYSGVKADKTLPLVNGNKGVASTDNLGFCYTTMNLTSLPYTAVTCPAINNSSKVCSGGTKAGQTCSVNADCTGGGTCVTNAGWSAGTDAALYQSQASYDAGLGWTWGSSKCTYSYGIKGILNADMRGPDGAIANLTPCGGGAPVPATAGTCVDLSAVATQGDCLAVGATWDNWLPTLGGAAPGATDVSVNAGAWTIKKLDATTSIAAGGGKFYSGTGSVCLRCHSDESRAMMERNKPGYIETGHRLSGDTAPWTAVGTPWGLKGVQCEICHATGKPTQQDLGLVIYPNTTGTNSGLPRAASGHNQTEYGSHVTGVCFGCHGKPTAPDTGNPAATIPVSGGDFALTAKNLAPIANQFLNSPHAQYSGNSKTVNIITKTNYNSHFLGKICRSGSEVTDAAANAAATVDVTALSTCGAGGTLACNVAANCTATAGGNRTWNAVTSKCYDRSLCTGAGKTWDATTLRCVETQTTCQAQSDSGYNFVWSTTGVNGNPSIITASGAGCYKVFGNGNIVTTYWDGAAAKTIPASGSATNTACTDPVTGAGGFWTNEGEPAGTANGVAYVPTDQGNCMTCHDVHWSLDSTNPKAEPIRRECGITCHSDKSDWSTINHPMGAGTPIGDGTDLSRPCETCHMPPSSATGSRMHLFRINTSSAYTTMGTTNVNTAADGTYANAAWVDLDHACGQCHGGSAGPTHTQNGAPYFDTTYLSFVAAGMHSGAMKPPTAAYTSLVTNTGLAVSFTDNSADNNFQPQSTLSVSVNWGDGKTSAGVGGGVFPHTYASAGKYTIIHTVTDSGSRIASELIPITIATTTPTTYSISVHVQTNAAAAISGATVYLQKQVGTGWAQIRYAYTNATGDKTFANLTAGLNYRVVVYKSTVDFYGNLAGKQPKVVWVAPAPLTANVAETFAQGNAATNGPLAAPWRGTNGTTATVTP
jgi:hypothetical protein